MRNKAAQERQETIQRILTVYGTIDTLDIRCLEVRFHVGPEVITEDVRMASEALERQRVAQERAVRLKQERAAELTLAREILKRGGV
jgi:hypothetical protein